MKDLTSGNIYKTFILFAFPLVLSGILSQCYNLIDTVIAGRYLGDAGLAAIGATSAFITFSSSIFWGYASGAAIHIAALFGARKFHDIKKAVYHNLWTVTFAALAYGILVALCSNQILAFLQVDPIIRAEAKIYLNIYVIGFFLVLLNNNFVQILHSFGVSGFPFYMSLISAVLNISGNILSITVLGMGVEGVALSTLFAALTVNICYLFKLRTCFREMGVLHEKVSFDFEIVCKISRYALPCSVQQLIMYVSGLLISPLVNGIGSHASAAYTVVHQIQNFVSTLYYNSSKVVGTYTAQCVGAGKIGQLKKGVRTGILQSTAYIAIPLIACVMFAEPVCSMFFPTGYHGEGLYYAVIFVRFYLPFIWFNLINNLFHSFYRGTGSMKLLVSLTATGSITRIIFSVIFIHFFGMQGVYIGWVLCWVCESILAFWSYFAGGWKKTLPFYNS